MAAKKKQSKPKYNLEFEKPPTFMYMGVKFPWYFVDPRWVQTNDMSFTLAIDNSEWPASQNALWNSKYLPELAKLAKKVLEKLTNSKVKPL